MYKSRADIVHCGQYITRYLLKAMQIIKKKRGKNFVRRERVLFKHSPVMMAQFLLRRLIALNIYWASSSPQTPSETHISDVSPKMLGKLSIHFFAPVSDSLCYTLPSQEP